MKKWISLALALSLLLSAAVIPAMAEEPAGGTDAVTSASVMKGGRNGRNAAPGRQMPSGQHGRNRTPSDTAAPQAEPPAAPELPAEPELPAAPEQPAESNAPDSSESAPSASSGKQVKKSSGNTARTAKKGKASVSAGSLTVTLDLLLEKGVISQDVYQAILAFIQSNSLLEAASPDDSNG
ncbi:hypothetical protein JNO48_12535 [Clostridiales bacterium]|nr:hypothetical protein JNO48_12535 [Clostridiales bacterium]